MTWEQVQLFDPQKMGSAKGWCLQNTRLGFGINRGYYPTALAAMLANKNAGTLHSINSLPENISVPVFIDSTADAEHVGALHHGVYWSDGKISTLPKSRVFGWGETLENVRIVRWNYESDAPANSGSMIATSSGIRVRTAPSISTGDTGARYQAGQKLNYDQCLVADGIYWLSYISRSKVRHYVMQGYVGGSRWWWGL